MAGRPMTTAPHLYAVLDLAADPSLAAHVARLEPDAAACLFEGKLHPQIKAASPHVVELAPSDPLSVLWRGDGWGKAWGLLISSSDLRRFYLALERQSLALYTLGAQIAAAKGG